MHQPPHIETITRGHAQRGRITIGYRVVANGTEIARFIFAPHEAHTALEAARKVLAEAQARNT